MADFFNEGCPGLFKREITGPQGPEGSPYVTDYVRFDVDGRKLEPSEAGSIEPDAVRIVPVDDYEGPTYRDQVYAFTVDVADAQIIRADNHIPGGNVFVLPPEYKERLKSVCDDCAQHTDKCPVLEAVMRRALELYR